MKDGIVALYKVVAFVEALTWVALLIGMYYKWVLGHETAVRVPGMTHGVVFVVFVVLTFAVAWLRKWDLKTLALGLISTVPPLCSVVFELWADRTGRLSARSTDPDVREPQSVL